MIRGAERTSRPVLLGSCNFADEGACNAEETDYRPIGPRGNPEPIGFL